MFEQPMELDKTLAANVSAHPKKLRTIIASSHEALGLMYDAAQTQRAARQTSITYPLSKSLPNN